MKPNHIFIFCDNHDEVANELMEFGFIEGSSRIHPNQGTRNRKFYFNDFYIEILWVCNIDEITSKLTRPTDLYNRSMYETNDYSPFGLCVNYSSDGDELFKNSMNYKPTYLPPNSLIEVLTNEDSVTLPWTFRWKSDVTNHVINEPMNFSNKELLKVIFYIQKEKVLNHYLDFFSSNVIFFENSEKEYLKLVFNNDLEKITKIFNTVPLIIEY